VNSYYQTNRLIWYNLCKEIPGQRNLYNQKKKRKHVMQTQTRRFNEANIGLMALGKAVEAGRQLRVTTSGKFAKNLAQKSGADPQTLQKWSKGYVAIDAIISITGLVAVIQGMRKNRKGAGQAALIQAGATIIYGLYYLFYSLFALKKAKAGARLVNIIASFGHIFSGIQIYRFAQRALKS
jgi:hypothetical protein